MILLLLVIAARIISPLVVFRHRLLGVVLTIFFDFADFQILQSEPSISLGNEYQLMDKFLDMLYLTVFVFEMHRSVPKSPIKKIGYGSFIYRMIPMTLLLIWSLIFTQGHVPDNVKSWFIIFPNFFEFYYIYLAIYHHVHKKWPDLKDRNVQITLLLLLLGKFGQELFLHNPFFDSWAVWNGFLDRIF